MAEEKAFETRIRRLIKALCPHSWSLKTISTGEQRAGVPDCLFCINGKFLAIEFKASKGKPSALQIREKSMIEAAGGVCWILYPKDEDRFVYWLKEWISA